MRNSWVTKEKSSDRAAEGYIDAASFEEVKKKGDSAVEKWIDDELKGTSVTVVLIGKETNDRKFIKYEIERSIDRGNGLLGIYINKIENQNGEDDEYGKNPFDQFQDLLKENNYSNPKIYYWFIDEGYRNIDKWIEDAAKERGK